MTVTIQNADAVGAKGKTIFRDAIRPQLTDADKGKYITINIDTGEWIIDTDLERLHERDREHFDATQTLYTMRAGYRSIFSLRPGLNLELDEW